QYFDLANDPTESHNAINDPEHQPDVARLRAALIDALRDRPEGFVADGALVPGRPISPLLPFVEV
ncbi:MAG: arylsulfatase, partial [Eubacteriales bacterium]|nr:arylsulfatase [Eubacteriales bacterium]